MSLFINPYSIFALSSEQDQDFMNNDPRYLTYLDQRIQNYFYYMNSKGDVKRKYKPCILKK